MYGLELRFIASDNRKFCRNKDYKYYILIINPMLQLQCKTITGRCCNTIYDQICEEYKRLQYQIKQLEQQISELPDGSLIIAKNRQYFKWYHKVGDAIQYLKKENYELAEKLAYKRYLSLQLEDLQHERAGINMYLNHHRLKTGKATQLLCGATEYSKLIESQVVPLADDLKAWMNEVYDKNQKYPEQLIHKSISGNYVRSKSESLIEIALCQHQIPYRYENSLTLNDITIYPDFTLRHPVTGKFKYWEHFGMMDNVNYAKNACDKLQLYTSNGLIPSIDVIITFETRDHPLTCDMIESMIQQHFR